ncbi:MAG TPA: alpha/beta hydrolase-fold protein [Anaerolineales bacterium]|nr:alpha/beta hydrolase-fold protein [Anaerolineales bacterium]
MPKLKQVPVMATEVRMLKSRATGKTYRLSIALPLAYNNHERVKIVPLDESRDAWPVVYVLDPYWLFDMATGMVRYNAWSHRTTDALIVGIGYPEGRSIQATWQQSLAARTHDLTPRQSDRSEMYNSEWLKVRVKTGGGPEFLRFLERELIPLIDQEYPADAAKRILAGHSHGGGFALFAMLQEPELFRTYIASSPSLDYADNFLFTLESEYAEKHKALHAQVYLSAGELEQVVSDEDETLTNMYRFAAVLESRKYKGFSLVKNVFPDCNHAEAVTPALHAALRMALRA